MPYVSHEKLIENNKADYYVSLRKSQKTFKPKPEIVAPWLVFFMNVLLAQSKEAIGLFAKENIEKILSPKQQIIWQYLQTADEAAPLEIETNTQIARPTINQALNKLLRLNKIEKIGLGRGTRYRKL